jgi:hypothetical protein
MVWGYCDACGASISVGDSCWVETNYHIDEAKTFCMPCWDISPMCKDNRPDVRNVTLAFHRGPTILRAYCVTITADD